MSTRRALAAVGAAVAVTSGLVLAGAPANAAGTRPNFQVPFICGTTWQGAMYSSHNPRYAIDFNHYAADGSRDDMGRRVTASAKGTVTKVVTGLERSYGNHIIIKHANGWSTLYAHLRDGSIIVREGQAVKRGQVIGRVGASGLSDPDAAHLHYEQRADGGDVKPVFYRDKPASDNTKRAYKAPAC